MRTRSTISVTVAAGRPAAKQGSAVPERFRSVTAAEPGRSAVPPDFRSVTQPEKRSTERREAEPPATAEPSE